MYRDENFAQVGNLEHSVLVMKLPGIDIKCYFSTGDAFVNAKGTIGYVALSITDVVGEKTSGPITEAAVSMAETGNRLAELLADSKSKRRILAFFAKEKLRLVYSLTKDGKEILTMPGVDGDGDHYFIGGMIIARYSLGDGKESPAVFERHASATSWYQLAQDRDALVAPTLSLVDKTNDAYKEFLKLTETIGLRL